MRTSFYIYCQNKYKKLLPIIPFPNCLFYLSCIGKEPEQIYLCTFAIKETKCKQEYYLERANEKSKFFVNEMKFFITYEPIKENTTYYNNYVDLTDGFSFDCILQPV